MRRVAVGISGGKDSVVTLDLCVKEFGAENVVGWFMWMVPDLASVEGPAIQAAARVGVQLHKVPHWHVSNLFRNAVLMPPRREKIKQQKLADTEAHVRRLTGVDWITYGWRADDSITRRIMFKRWGEIWDREPSRRFFPIAHWHVRDVLGYLRANRLPIPPRFGGNSEGGPSGFDLSVPTLRYLKEHHPDDYQRVLKQHPFAEAQLIHAEMHGAKK